MTRSPFVLAAALFSLPAAASVVSSAAPVAARAGSGWVLGYPPSGGAAIAASARTITADAAAATVRDLIPIAAPGGSLAVNAARTVTLSSAALGALQLAGKVAAPIGVGMALYDLYKGSGLRHGPDGALQVDRGTEPSEENVSEYWISPDYTKSGSLSNACTSYRAYIEKKSGNIAYDPSKNPPYVPYKVVGFLVDDAYLGPRCQIDLVNPWTGAVNSKWRYEAISKQTVKKKVCGTGEVRLDGLCVTEIWVDAKQVDDSNKLANLQKAITALGLGSVLQKLLDSGQTVQGSAVSVSGPASQNPPPETSVTTGPAGQVSTTNNTTYNYNYSGDTITYTTSVQTTTTTTAIDGTKTTETKNETKTPDPIEDTLCDVLPDALSCLKVGTVPDAENLPSNVKTVAPGRHSAWSYSAGQCPNRIIDFSFGVSINILQPFCDFFVILKGVILSIFSLASALVFRGGIR